MPSATIAWDVDDVLNDLMHVWLEEFWKPAHPRCSLHLSDIRANPPAALLNVPLSDYLASLDDFRLSGRYARLAPRPDVLVWFNEHGSCFHHLALTAVPACAAAISAEWVMRHFGRWIRSFHFVPSPRARDVMPSYDASKNAFLRRHGGVSAFIDDSPANVEPLRGSGIKAILFPRPWNESTMTPEQALQTLLEGVSG